MEQPVDSESCIKAKHISSNHMWKSDSLFVTFHAGKWKNAGKAESRKAEFLAAEEACKAIFQLTGLTGGTFEKCGISAAWTLTSACGCEIRDPHARLPCNFSIRWWLALTAANIFFILTWSKPLPDETACKMTATYVPIVHYPPWQGSFGPRPSVVGMNNVSDILTSRW